MANGKQYFSAEGRWLRYDKDSSKVFQLSSDTEAVYRDFRNLSNPINNTFLGVTLPSYGFFLLNLWWPGGNTFGSLIFMQTTLECVFIQIITPCIWAVRFLPRPLIGFYSVDTSLGYSKQDEAAPVISAPVITASSQNNLNMLVTVNHKFSYEKNNTTIIVGCSFIQSVILDYFYYKRGDTIRYPSIAMNNSTEIKYNAILVLRNDLFLSGYLLNYKITATDKAIFPHVTVYSGGGFTDVADIDNNIPNEYTLNQNYPNPFNPTTTIEFNIPKAGDVQLNVYDVLGNEIAVLINNTLNSGTHKINFSALNLSSGVYFYTLKFNGKQTITKKMILAK